MSIFSLIKGGKEHGVFEVRMFGGDILNSYNFNTFKEIIMSKFIKGIMVEIMSCIADGLTTICVVERISIISECLTIHSGTDLSRCSKII